MKPNRKLPLFIVSGASGAGKTTACTLLFQQEKDYVVMESDLLWNRIYDTPDDNYCAYRRMWMRVAAAISQIGKPVVLCGSAVPEQFENQPERELFSEIRYFAVVCNDSVLETRLRKGRGVTEEGRIENSVTFNRWLKENATKTKPEISLIDNSALSPERTAEVLDRMIRKQL
ncbi:MAG: AAA family ATPase [Clostridia bacterium]|nr:AAA family ATPase [Clostridia bacterium]